MIFYFFLDVLESGFWTHEDIFDWFQEEMIPFIKDISPLGNDLLWKDFGLFLGELDIVFRDAESDVFEKVFWLFYRMLFFFIHIVLCFGLVIRKRRLLIVCWLCRGIGWFGFKFDKLWFESWFHKIYKAEDWFKWDIWLNSEENWLRGPKLSNKKLHNNLKLVLRLILSLNKLIWEFTH